MKFIYEFCSTNVKFQPVVKPTGSFDKRFLLNKHNLYKVKLEASITYSGILVYLLAPQ